MSEARWSWRMNRMPLRSTWRAGGGSSAWAASGAGGAERAPEPGQAETSRAAGSPSLTAVGWRLPVGHANEADGWRGGEHLGDPRLVGPLGVAPQGVDRRDVPLVGGHRAELAIARRVARRVDVRDRGGEVRGGAQAEPSHLEADARGPDGPRMEAAADGSAHLAARHLVRHPGAVEGDAHAVGGPGEAGDVGLEPERHPALLHALAQVAGHVRVEAGEDLRVAREHSDAGAEVVEGPRQLERHRSRADEGERGRERGKEEELVGGDEQLAARHLWVDRLRARRDDEALGPERVAVDLDDVRVGEAGLADRHVDPALLEIGGGGPGGGPE